MNILKIKLIGATLLLASSTAFAQPSYYAVSGISDAGSLVVRAWPSSSSQPINNIPHNAIRVEATGRDIFKENKKWLQVKHQNSTGWVEADYLVEMQPIAPTPTAITQPPAVADSSAAFSYSPTTVAVSQQPDTQNVPWTPEEDTIYHDPTAQQLSVEDQIQTVEASHTLVVINNNLEPEDLRGENITGNRYQHIEASMSVMYQQ